ncbi:hypothetical protein [Amycolatopsis minnesotensis]|uniref:AAA+ ATPase domain-containing protein n=1 Tax=Amycolatopsis minnesotensis TaxID=337894 RepID=A0ABN2RQQ7_9PSEU
MPGAPGDGTNNQFGGTAENVAMFRYAGSVTMTTQQFAPPPQQRSWAVAAPEGTFTDRADILARIGAVAKADRETAAVVVLTGAAGVGKTAVLHRCAALLRPHFEFAVTADFGPLWPQGGVSLSDALAGMLTELYVDQRWIPATLADRRKRYLSLTEGEKVLVLLDNVHHAAEVLALIPNSRHALVLAASEFSLDDMNVPEESDLAVRADLTPLSGLPEDDAVELLAKICGPARDLGDEGQVRELVGLLGGSPVDLRVAGGRLKTRKTLEVGHLIEELTEELRRAPEEAPRGALGSTNRFDPAYRWLSAPAARMYRLLGALAAPAVPIRIIAAALGVPGEEAGLLADELLRVYLVEELPTGFRLPGAIRRHAHRVARQAADESEAMVEEAVKAWVADAADADYAVNANRLRVTDARRAGREPLCTSSRAAMDWFAANHDALLAVLRTADAGHWDEQTWQLFEAMWPFYSTHKLLHAWREAGALAVKAARRSGPPRVEARIRCYLSRAYVELGEFESAHTELVRARELTEHDEEVKYFASVLDFLGKAKYVEGEFAEALAVYRESLRLHEQIEDRRGIALQSQFVGRCLGELGEHVAALAAFDRADELLADSGDARTLSQIATSRAAVLVALGRDAGAVASLHRAVEIAGALGTVALIDKPLELLADLAHRYGDAEAERTYLRQVCELHDRTGSPRAAEFRRRLDSLTS